MTHTTHPQKEDVRSYLAQRRESREPPPSLEEIRRQLGWGMTQQNEISTEPNGANWRT